MTSLKAGANAGANANADAHAKAVAASRARYPVLHKNFMTLYEQESTLEGKKTIVNNAAEWARRYAVVALHGSRSPPGKAPARDSPTSTKPSRPDDPLGGARAEERCPKEQ